MCINATFRFTSRFDAYACVHDTLRFTTLACPSCALPLTALKRALRCCSVRRLTIYKRSAAFIDRGSVLDPPRIPRDTRAILRTAYSQHTLLFRLRRPTVRPAAMACGHCARTLASCGHARDLPQEELRSCFSFSLLGSIFDLLLSTRYVFVPHTSLPPGLSSDAHVPCVVPTNLFLVFHVGLDLVHDY